MFRVVVLSGASCGETVYNNDTTPTLLDTYLPMFSAKGAQKLTIFFAMLAGTDLIVITNMTDICSTPNKSHAFLRIVRMTN